MTNFYVKFFLYIYVVNTYIKLCGKDMYFQTYSILEKSCN